jgi:hypothetical protein
VEGAVAELRVDALELPGRTRERLRYVLDGDRSAVVALDRHARQEIQPVTVLERVRAMEGRPWPACSHRGWYYVQPEVKAKELMDTPAAEIEPFGDLWRANVRSLRTGAKGPLPNASHQCWPTPQPCSLRSRCRRGRVNPRLIHQKLARCSPIQRTGRPRPPTRWTSTPGGSCLSPTETLAYIYAHLPPGTRRELWGTGPGGPNVPENTFSGFRWPGSPGTLVVDAVRLANGSTALRVDAYVVWITPRAASERIPAGARLLTISVRSWARRSSGPEFNRLTILRRLPSRVTSVARIEKIVTLLNELRVNQPGRRGCCLLEFAGGSAQLSFYTSPNAPRWPLRTSTPYTAA